MENPLELKHIAVILDGNRRYAKAKNMHSSKGHEAGAEKVEDFLKWSRDLGIKEVTLYTLSIENLNRSKEELDYLFKLFKRWFKKFLDSKEVHENKVKIRFIGDLSLVPIEIKELALEIEEKTKDYDNYGVNFCFAYGGRQELINAVNKLIKSGIKEVKEEDLRNSLWLSNEPQLIIRPGGKIRTSNFLPWQSVYSEWMFIEKMWPDFNKEDLTLCVEKFNDIQRNFGK